MDDDRITLWSMVKQREPDLIRRAWLFIKSIAPVDFYDHRNEFNIIDEARLPDYLRPDSSCGALCLRAYDDGIANAIRAAGMPCDEGPVVIIKDATMRAGMSSLIGSVIHEAAHVIESLANPNPARITKRTIYTPDHPLSQSMTNGDELLKACAAPKWHGHDATFTRIALHLFYRAQCSGFYLDLDDISIAGNDYGLSPDYKYLAALEQCGEMGYYHRAQIPLLKLVNEPLPWAFSQLWAKDTAKTGAVAQNA